MSLLFVHFVHPGSQPSLNKDERNLNIKGWNNGSHKRKFMKAIGQYVLNNNTLSHKQDLLFWGEWEPMSFVTKYYKQKDYRIYPKHLHEPFLQVGNHGRVVINVQGLPPINTNNVNSKNKKYKLQSTDPFVFADCFYYAICKQDVYKSLRNLDPGSIILFGSTILKSNIGPYFALDTVFVVSDNKDYTFNTHLSDLNGFVPAYYGDIECFYINKNAFPGTYKCYKGASFQNPFNGMFSFVPCKDISHINNGFERVILTEKDLQQFNGKPVLTNNLMQGLKKTKTDLAFNQQIWNRLCQIVRKQGFELGLNFEYSIQNPPLKYPLLKLNQNIKP